MTRIDFYLKVGSKEDIARKLVTKAFKLGSNVLICTRDQRQAKDLDNYLWMSPQLSFLPHALSESPISTKSPVLIGDNPDLLWRADVLINFDPDVPVYFTRFKRVLEIVTQEPTDVEVARGRFRYYKERGYQLVIHDLHTL